MQHSLMSGSRNIFSAPLVVGQGLLGEIHRFIVMKAISAIESKAIAQGDSGSLITVRKPQYLLELLKLIFDAVFIHARACLLIIRTMKAGKPHSNSTSKELDGLTSDYVWSCVQQEVQLLLSIHLNKHVTVETGLGVISQTRDQQGSDLSNTMNSLDVSHLDLNSLMGRKRTVPFNFSAPGALSVSFQKLTGDSVNPNGTPNSTNGSSLGPVGSVGPNLFSFSNTSHFLSVSSYLRENRMLLESRPDVPRTENTEAAQSRYPVVCYPNPENIISVYRPVMEFVNAVEHEVALIDSSLQAKASPMGIIRRPCQLRIYLKNFIENTFLPDTLIALRARLQQKLGAPDALNAIISQQTEKDLGLHRPILSAVLSTDECLTEVKKIATALPEYGAECLQVGITLLQDFTGAMWRVYRSLSEVDSGGAMVPSADWAKDDDVIRFWKEFPGWRRMEGQEARLWASNALLRAKPTKGLEQQDVSSETISTTTTVDDSHIAPATVVTLGLSTECDSNATNDLNARLVIPFANGRRGSLDTMNQSDGTDQTTSNRKHLSGLLFEREATRLAAKEAVQLIHMIGDEVPTNQENQTVVHQLPTMRNVQLLKVLGRLTESLCWLSRRVLSLDTWLSQVRQRSQISGRASTTNTTSGAPPPRPRPPLVSTPFASCAQELNRLSEACLLMTYLEVRIQAYNHFGGLPQNVSYWCPVDDVDVDKYVTDYLMYLEHVQDMLVHTFSRHKFRFIFDGLGDFISQLLLRLIPRIPRMNTNGNKKMCRNVYRLQQALASLTETHESDLIRVKQLYELFHLTPENVVNRLMEQGVAFDQSVYRDLLYLYQRSHPTHAYSKTEESMAKLASVVSKTLT
ncbi:Exocyst complex component 4 [Fasciola gigantica]|uniref:Exocyst complex component Sec8 n=1 Tax=Fasciola gigantica TaxID=46835 RepID=A0A504YB01_FASGI|nr:Exocyst complex component 4 [Fasciola gigantica]